MSVGGSVLPSVNRFVKGRNYKASFRSEFNCFSQFFQGDELHLNPGYESYSILPIFIVQLNLSNFQITIFQFRRFGLATG